jgi:very-short-patch-repair endonuclease
MTTKSLHKSAWSLARRQHGVITREQLLALGFSPAAIRHRLADGRLHPKWRGVYAVGRPGLTREGLWMAATLTCKGVLSHSTGAALWAIRPDTGRIEVTVPATRRGERPGIVVHRKQTGTTKRRGIPVASVLTDFALERRFLPIVRQVGSPRPQTRTCVNGFRVNFYWPALGLVVETDGLRYHRTPAQQAVDRVRDQTHAAAGLTPLRFTRAQVAYEPDHVRVTLAAVAARLG